MYITEINQIKGPDISWQPMYISFFTICLLNKSSMSPVAMVYVAGQWQPLQLCSPQVHEGLNSRNFQQILLGFSFLSGWWVYGSEQHFSLCLTVSNINPVHCDYINKPHSPLISSLPFWDPLFFLLIGPSECTIRENNPNPSKHKQSLLLKKGWSFLGTSFIDDR